MTLRAVPRADRLPRGLDELGLVETHALRLTRMWSWGVVHRETLRLAAATQFGAAQGVCVVGTFDALFARLEAHLSPALTIRPPDSARLDADEVWLLGLVAAAGTGPPGALADRFGERVAAGAARDLAESLQGFVWQLSACLAGRPAHPAGAGCARACPIRAACPEGPRLVVVR